MIHIAPWRACVGLLEDAARLLAENGIIYFYGPFVVDGNYGSEGNEAFDFSLHAQNPDWDFRSLDRLCEAAQKSGFLLDQIIEMPVNNLSVVFRREERN